MLNWFRRRRLSPEARRHLLILAARSEEAIIETHVSNAIELLEGLGDEVDLDRGIDLYEEMMGLQPPSANAIRTRVLARLDSPAPPRAGRAAGLAPGDAARARPRRKER